MLREFLANRSTPCPRCRFDLRDVREPRCPECGEAIRLQVGATRPLVGWWIVAIAPGIFSAIAGTILAIPIGGTLLFGKAGGIPPEVWFCEAVAIVSVSLLVGLWRGRWWFLTRRPRTQGVLAASIWAMHVAAAAYALFGL